MANTPNPDTGSTSGALKEKAPSTSTGSATTSVGSSGNHGQETKPQATTPKPTVAAPSR